MLNVLLGLDTTRGDDPLDSNVTGDTAPADQQQMPDFLTVQSLTYSGSMIAIGIIWNLAQRMSTADLVRGPWLPVVLGGLLVLAGLLYAWNDLGAPTKKASATIIAAFNAALLAAGALGISTAASTVAPIAGA